MRIGCLPDVKSSINHRYVIWVLVWSEQVRMNQMNNKLPQERVDVWVARCDGSRHRYYGLNGVRNLRSPMEVAATIQVRCRRLLRAYRLYIILPRAETKAWHLQNNIMVQYGQVTIPGGSHT